MDFNLDDPLGDILSDNSNDSFFETSKKKTVPTKSSEKKSIGSSNAKMQDLFGIKDTFSSKSMESKVLTTPQVSSVAVPAKKPSSPSPISVVSKPKQTLITSKSESYAHNDDEDVDLGFDPKKPKSTKSNILDDLLLSIDPPKNTEKYTSRPLTGSAISNKNISRQSTETTDNSGTGTSYGTSLPTARPKTSTGQRQSVTSINNPLGLFGTSSATSLKEIPMEIKQQDTPSKIKRRGTTADWLGLDLAPESTKPVKEVTSSQQDNTQILTIHPIQAPAESVQSIYQTFQRPQTPINLAANPNQSAVLMATANIEAQGALQTLQQQESQVMMATQLKNQEMVLVEMQKRQHDLLAQQEMKFNDLLQRQITKQNNLEVAIRSQQDRINAHIQVLMSTSSVNLESSELLTSVHKNKKTKQSENLDEEDKCVDSIKLEHEVKRLELEKLRLEDLLSNIRANHEKELEFVENSHKKQINLLEENLESTEIRLQSEIKSIQEFYTKKLESLESERNSVTMSYEDKIKLIISENEKAIAELKSTYDISIQSLKDDHKSMIDTIRQSKLLEFAVVQENTSYLQTLRNASNNLENISGDLQTLRDEMYTKIDVELKEKEKNLNAREKKLEDTERRLKISEQSNENEKSRLIELVTTLEIQLQNLSKDSADEQWLAKQKMSSLEAERAAFEREKEFTREQITREAKRIEEMKQLQLQDNQKSMQQIQDEKQLLAIEKSKLDTAKKLEQTSDSKTSKAEIDIALKVAQDATRQADQERERFFKMQRQLEIRKRELVDQENEIRSKHDELDAAIAGAKIKEQKVQENLQRQRYTEQNFHTKIQFLQNQIRQISDRESQLSQERLVLSKERLDLQDFKRKIEMNKCSLCRIGERSTAISNILTGNDIYKENEYNNFGNNNEDVQLGSIFERDNINGGNEIDKLFDKDIADSLKRMELINRNLGNNDEGEAFLEADLNPTFINATQGSGIFLDSNLSAIEYTTKFTGE